MSGKLHSETSLSVNNFIAFCGLGRNASVDPNTNIDNNIHTGNTDNFSNQTRTMSLSDEEEQPLVSDRDIVRIRHEKVSMLHVCMLISIVLLGSTAMLIAFLPSAQNTIRLFEDMKPEKEIMLFGDSLVGVPNTMFHMGDRIKYDIQKQQPDFDVIISPSASNGNKVQDLLDRVDKDVINRPIYSGGTRPPPDAVIILFDSDAVDVDEGNHAEGFRSSYRENLNELIIQLKAKIEFIALTGPILAGEKPEGDNTKDAQLDAYEAINKEVAAAQRVNYIALRELFQSKEPTKGRTMMDDKGKLTIDGEHPKQSGSDLISEAFVTQALSWSGLWKATVKFANRWDALKAKNEYMPMRSKSSTISPDVFVDMPVEVSTTKQHGEYYQAKKDGTQVHGPYHEEKNEKKSK